MGQTGLVLQITVEQSHNLEVCIEFIDLYLIHSYHENMEKNIQEKYEVIPENIH